MDTFQNLAKRLTSRKLWLAIIGTVMSYMIAKSDGVITGQEQAFIGSFFLSFIGMEGLADMLRAQGNINVLDKKKK